MYYSLFLGNNWSTCWVHILVFDFTDSLELVDLLGTIFPVYHNGSHGNQSVAFRLLQKTDSSVLAQLLF